MPKCCHSNQFFELSQNFQNFFSQGQTYYKQKDVVIFCCFFLKKSYLAKKGSQETFPLESDKEVIVWPQNLA